MTDLATKIVQLEALRATFGDDWVDAAIAALHTEQAKQQHTDDGSSIVDAQQTVSGASRGAATQGMHAASGGQISDAAQVTGDNNQVTINPEAVDHVTSERERALIDYLRKLHGECSPLQLNRIDAAESRYRRSMRLDQVYISLYTTTWIEEPDTGASSERDKLVNLVSRATQHMRGEEPHKRPLTALETITRGTPRRLMLLGAPGSGKSTFVNHLVLCLAGAFLAERLSANATEHEDWLERLGGWNLGALLPVRIVLRDLAAFAPLAQSTRGSRDLLLDFLRHTLGANAAALEQIRAELTAGKAILLLDGLDEVVGDAVLARVAECIEEAANTYHCPIVITCRELDYQANPLRQLRGFDDATLASLTNEQIDGFVDAWYTELVASGREMLGNADALRHAISSRPELRDLARLPLLLTMMAVVHAGKGTLPDDRALLYYECIDLLLLRWRQESEQVDMIEQLRLPQFRASDLLALMARLGFAAHEAAERTPELAARPADLSRDQVRRLLEKTFAAYSAGDPIRRDALVSQVLHAIALRNGLLLKQSGENGERYAFPHRTFQEFLAGYHLKGQRNYHQLCLERAPKSHWHEALALMVGYQVLADRELEKPILLVERLMKRSLSEQTLASELLALIGRERAASYDRTLVVKGGLWDQTRRMLFRLSTRGQYPEAPALLRVRAGLALGTLSYGSIDVLNRPEAHIPLVDPRLPLTMIGLPSQHDPNWSRILQNYWCPIRAGSFWHDDSYQRRGATLDLKLNNLDYGYRCARYPLTNADYARFVAMDGYAERRWWTAEGWKHHEIYQLAEPRYWHDRRYSHPFQPIVGVSWYEAVAYCAWLTAQGHTQGWLLAGEVIRLPTWLEWERTAQHTDKRRYPWGDDIPSIEYANYEMSGFDQPTPVGCFPAGAAACGAQDLAGNVLEWTGTPYERANQLSPQKDFQSNNTVVVSWSSWAQGAEYLRCGARYGFLPLSRGDFLGFRLIRL